MEATEIIIKGAREHNLRNVSLTLPRNKLICFTGVSGSGKSHVAEGLTGWLPAVCVRSDVERKRLLGLDAHEDATAEGAYSAELTELTYARLADFATDVVQGRSRKKLLAKRAAPGSGAVNA